VRLGEVGRAIEAARNLSGGVRRHFVLRYCAFSEYSALRKESLVVAPLMKCRWVREAI